MKTNHFYNAINACSKLILLYNLCGTATAEIVTLNTPHMNIYYDNTQPGMTYFGTPALGTNTTSSSLTFATLDPSMASSADGFGATTRLPLDKVGATFTFRVVPHPGVRIDRVMNANFGTHRNEGVDTVCEMDGSIAVFDQRRFTQGDLLASFDGKTMSFSDRKPSSNLNSWSSTAIVPTSSPSWDTTTGMIIVLNNSLSAESVEAGTSARISNNITGVMMSIRSE